MPLEDIMASQLISPPLTDPASERMRPEDIPEDEPEVTLVEESSAESGYHGSSMPTHPLGVKPLGNKYLSNSLDAKDAAGLFRTLSDEMVMHFLEYLDAPTLSALGYTCKFLFACCDYDDLWKSLALEAEGWQPDTWRGTWRASLRTVSQEAGGTQIDCSNVFSDILHRPFVCSNINLDEYASGIPKANQIRRFDDLTYKEFSAKWSSTPFILTECIRHWPVLEEWSLDNLRARYADTGFRAESVDWPYSLYDQYLRNTTDESPLYLFDRKFVEKMGIRVGDSNSQEGPGKRTDSPTYWKPDCFGPDLFESLGSDRPAHRWVIIGPARSGSTFHKDPNGTSAWNAVVQGVKYWIMFPPAMAVPGVYVSADKSEVTSPLSIAEWLLTFHAEARLQPGCIEGVCHMGEILHVPSGWWHLVVNLEAGIALTQNFVPKSHLAQVLLFLRDRPEQVTGFARTVADPYGLFVERLEETHPDALAHAREKIASGDNHRERSWNTIVRGESKRKCDDESLLNGHVTIEDNDSQKRPKTDGGFTFGFGGAGDADEIP